MLVLFNLIYWLLSLDTNRPDTLVTLFTRLTGPFQELQKAFVKAGVSARQATLAFQNMNAAFSKEPPLYTGRKRR
jgi:hypothetical protein